MCFNALVCNRDRMILVTARLIGVSCNGRFAWVAARCRSCSCRLRGLSRP